MRRKDEEEDSLKRRIEEDEERAVFIWQLLSGEFTIVETTLRNTHFGLQAHSPSTLIGTANSIEEALLKMQCLCPNEKLLKVHDTIVNEDFCSPFEFVDLLEPDFYVYEVTA